MAIATGLPTAPCTTPYGDLVVRLAVQNRQDYARLHSLELHVMAESADPRLRIGAWQKLGLVRKVQTAYSTRDGWTLVRGMQRLRTVRSCSC